MPNYFLKRILYTVPIMLAVSLVCFMLVQIAPGDPISAIVPIDATQEVVDRLKALYGLDQPLPVQFWRWLVQVTHGDLGTSIGSGKPVMAEVGTALVNTLRLSLMGACIGFVAGTLLGITAASFQGRWPDKVLSTIASAGVSVPHYWLGMVLVVIFSVKLGMLPAMGAGPGASSDWKWDWAHLQFMILPAVTIAIIPMAIVMRTVRGAVTETMNQEFVTTLRAKGLLRGGVWRHLVKNAAPGVLAVMGLQLGYLLGGSILVETIFSWPGTGLLLNSAIFTRDIPLLQGTILILALIFVLLNLAVDLMQTALDPRIRRT